MIANQNQNPEFERAIDALEAGSDELSVQRFRRMAANGDGHADAVLGICHEFGIHGLAQDAALALEHYRKAIQKSRSLEGELGVARIGLRLATSPEEVIVARDIYRRHAEAAERSEPWIALGRVALYGLDGSVDLEAAQGYFRRATGFGDPFALTGLALVAWRSGRYFESIRLRMNAVRASIRRDLGSKARK